MSLPSLPAIFTQKETKNFIHYLAIPLLISTIVAYNGLNFKSLLIAAACSTIHIVILYTTKVFDYIPIISITAFMVNLLLACITILGFFGELPDIINISLKKVAIYYFAVAWLSQYLMLGDDESYSTKSNYKEHKIPEPNEKKLPKLNGNYRSQTPGKRS